MTKDFQIRVEAEETIDNDIAELEAALFQTNDYPLAQQAILAAIAERRNAKEHAE